MSKTVCIVVNIDDSAFEIMKGGSTRRVFIQTKGDMQSEQSMECFDADLTTESGKFFQADAIGIMLLAERQKIEAEGVQRLLDENPDLFTTKE